jgi:hypothetical protein
LPGFVQQLVWLFVHADHRDFGVARL